MPAKATRGFSMSTQTYYYSVLAFCLFVKSRKANSVLYGRLKAYLACKEYDLNVQTYCKYIATLKGLNLIDTDNAGNMHIASIPKLLKALIPGLEGKTFTAFRYCRFFTGMPVQSSVKAYKDQIERALLKLNASQQEFHIASKKQIQQLNSGSSNVIPASKYKRLLKQYGASSLTSLQSTLNTLKDAVVTGKEHLAGLIGTSASTASKRLRKWDLEGSVSRRINRVFIECSVSFRSSDTLKESYPYACPNPDRTGYWITLGSQILGFKH